MANAAWNGMPFPEKESRMEQSYISVVKTDCYVYPKADTLFRPDTKYPEYPFADISQQKNEVYAAVREALHLLKLDEEHYGTPAWDPLGGIVKPGDCVLVKPNLVLDVNENKSNGTECLYTQPAVTAAVMDYVWIALRGTGKIVVGDAPMWNCDFEHLVEESGYTAMIEYYRDKGVPVELVDCRQLRSAFQGKVRYDTIDESIKGKPVRLDSYSEFATMDADNIKRLRAPAYDPRIMNEHHNQTVHEYYVSEYVLNADVIINLPKPKSHKKAGITAALKNMVGICARKDSLPHHTKGSPDNGGDDYPANDPVLALRGTLQDKYNMFAAERHFLCADIVRQAMRACSWLRRLMKKRYMDGIWYGNHTLSRSITDLNKIIFYADKTGTMQEHPVRRMFIVADMIVSGEREGPLSPSPKNVGIIAAGQDPICFDEVICTLMGFDIKAIPTLAQVRSVKGKFMLPGAKAEPMIISNVPCYDGKKIGEIAHKDLLDFIPGAGWQGHIEIR